MRRKLSKKTRYKLKGKLGTKRDGHCPSFGNRKGQRGGARAKVIRRKGEAGPAEKPGESCTGSKRITKCLAENQVELELGNAPPVLAQKKGEPEKKKRGIKKKSARGGKKAETKRGTVMIKRKAAMERTMHSDTAI